MGRAFTYAITVDRGIFQHFLPHGILAKEPNLPAISLSVELSFTLSSVQSVYFSLGFRLLLLFLFLFFLFVFVFLICFLD